MMALSAPPAFADQKSDLYGKGMAGFNAGDPFAAQTAFCQLAKIDGAYKPDPSQPDATTQCAEATKSAERTTNRYKANYAEGLSLMGDGKLDEAAAKFRTVKAGDYADKAKAQLDQIAKLKQQQADSANNAAAAEQNAKKNLDAGNAAFSQGNMDAAESTLKSVTGSHQGEAQATLQKIAAYKAAVAKGQIFENAKDYQAAKNAYAEAVNINPAGPAAGMLSRVSSAATSAATSNNPPPNNTTAVVKPPPARPQIDVATYMADGNKAMAKKDYKKARRFFNDVLGQDRNNQEAKDALAQLNSVDTAQGNASDEDATLKDIITAYYAGSQDAEDRLKTYIYAKQGKKLGLANFYLGASMMSRYYLSGANDQRLKSEAISKFKAAKTVDGFKAPDKFVSPKIMKAFEEAS